MKKVLILAPHTDDGELGCGASISKLLRMNYEVFYVAFSSCKDSLPKTLPNDVLEKELYIATESLGISKKNVILLDYAVRHFQEHRQDILDDMLEIRNTINPDIVFAPSIHDIHQDHITIAQESLRAFKKKILLSYEVPWNNLSFDNQVFITVDDKDVENKIAAIKCYYSQNQRDYTNEDYIKSSLIMHGVQIGEKYAEVFEASRIVI